MKIVSLFVAGITMALTVCAVILVFEWMWRMVKAVLHLPYSIVVRAGLLLSVIIAMIVALLVIASFLVIAIMSAF